jgi:hypothetical protein
MKSFSTAHGFGSTVPEYSCRKVDDLQNGQVGKSVADVTGNELDKFLVLDVKTFNRRVLR